MRLIQEVWGWNTVNLFKVSKQIRREIWNLVS